ncbi:competence type IV pilus ATPase ComGA [Bacillus tianshenii]|nr:competence type IV pilus ATPase ComGA [Bacillus tianshenii]
MIEKLSLHILESALSSNASDIHFTPSSEKTTVSFRIDGRLYQHSSLGIETTNKLVSHYKFISGMDIGERRRPQSGALMSIVKHERVYLRFSSLPTVHGNEGLVIRLIPQNRQISLKQIALFPNDLKHLLRLLHVPNGLFLITGPTGSGKTTTLYALLKAASEQFHAQILTLEDPVERYDPAFTQVQMNEKAGLTYEAGIMAAMRHDPDVLVIGEIRDAQTAKMAVRAAYTGHLVISTLHTKRAVEAVYRLLELGVPRVDLEQTLVGVAAQELVELQCPFCSEVCSVHCRKLRGGRRAGIFELLMDQSLQNLFLQLKGEKDPFHLPCFTDQIRKGIALGYLSESLLTRGVVNV